MRRKRELLLFARSDARVRELRFLLEMRGYRVRGTHELAQLREALGDGSSRCDALVAEMDRGAELGEVIGLRRDLRTVWLSSAGELPCEAPTGIVFQVLPQRDLEATLLEYVRLATTLKRGPRRRAA